jgi:hypothetical protein
MSDRGDRGSRMPEIGRKQPGDLAGAVLAGIREASDRLVRAAT